MTITINGMEWARFGEGYVKRANADEDWVEVPLDDAPVDVQVEIRADELIRAQGGIPVGFSSVIRRAPENEERARKLGFTGDETVSPFNQSPGGTTPADVLAQRLNDAGSEGTNTRLPEEEFDAIAEEMDIDPQEMRDRFAGRHGK